MNSFLHQTALSVIDTVEWNRLNRTTLVLPSHRAGLVLKEELLKLQQERHAHAIWAPQVMTLTQLQDALSPLYAEDEVFTIVRLYKHFTALTPLQSPISFDLFYGWGRQMLADFTNVDASMPAEEVPGFFDNTVAAHELEKWKLDPEVEERLCNLLNPFSSAVHTAAPDDSVKARYELLWHKLYDLYQLLKAEMKSERKGYNGMRQRAVIEHWEDDSIQQQIAGRTYVFVGFNYLLPVERELMEKLRDNHQALFYWDYAADFQTNEKAFSFARQNSAVLGNALPPRSWGGAKEITVVSATSREAQAQFVHRWLTDNYTAKGQKVGVVICDETMLEPVIYTLPAITLPGESEPSAVNITKGFPLSHTKIYADVLRWLASPDRGGAQSVVTPEITDELLAFLFPEAAERSEAEELSDESLTWQELLILESGYQVRKIVNQIRRLITQGIDGVPFTIKLLRMLMRRMMENVSMPFHGEPITDIQVMGVLETRLLDFDKLLLLNVEEGVLPQKQIDISFIPFYLRKAWHMQTSEERATVYAYNFYRLLSRAGNATLLFSPAETSDGGKGMSRFIMQMLVSPEFNVTKMQLQEDSALREHGDGDLSDCAQASLLSTLVVGADGILRRPSGKRYRLSPSALNTYIACPRSFYYQYILGLRPKEDEEVLFAPNTLGSFVHHAMEYLYTRYLHCDNVHPVSVTPDEIELIRTNGNCMQEALQAAYQAMNEEYEKEFPGQAMHFLPEHHTAENVIILGYVSNILERDREDAGTGLMMYLLEQERTFPVYIDGIGEILTGGTIDRLDIYGQKGNERLRVIDYKSGSYNETTHAKKMSSSWEELMESDEKGYVRQTLIYSHAVAHNSTLALPVEPNLYFCRRKLTDIETTIELENETIRDYKSVSEQFYNVLREKIKQLLTTTGFPQCGEGKCPAYCPFFSLCGRQPSTY